MTLLILGLKMVSLNNFDVKDFMKLEESKINAYRFELTSLSSINTKEDFQEKSRSLLKEMIEDEEYEQQTMKSYNIPIPAINLVCRARDERIKTLQFYSLFKTLNDF